MKEAVVVTSVRTPVGKALKGSFRDTRPDDLAAAALKGALERTPGLHPEEVDDVILGCAMPEGEQGMNVARVACLRAGIPIQVSAFTINRFCSSGLQAIALGAQQIMCGMAEVVVAGGTESMTMVPMGGNKFSANPTLAENYPEVYIGMGLTAENLAEQYGVSREDQDRFSLRSHERAIAAIQGGRFREEIVPVATRLSKVREDGGVEWNDITVEIDEGPRADTSFEKLASLKAAFKQGGTVTAGNASQMSDGAAATILMSREKAETLGLEPLAAFRSFATAGVPPEVMGIGPVEAVPKALRLAGLRLDQVDLIELNEAFAAQALAVIQQLELDEKRVNVNGGAVALGHPLGCTGAKLTATVLHEMKRRGARYGLVTMCIGGGMGAAGVFERA